MDDDRLVAIAKQYAESEAREEQKTEQANKEAAALQRDLDSMSVKIENLATKQQLEELKTDALKVLLGIVLAMLALSVGAAWTMAQLILRLLQSMFQIHLPPV